MTSNGQQILAPQTTGDPFPWLFAYFRQIYAHRVDLTPNGIQLVRLSDEDLLAEALHLAFSYDGLHWTPLNRNQPIPGANANQRIRDPFLQRGCDGTFHLLATGGMRTTDIYYARSEDLIHWHDQRSLPVMGTVTQARNAWAPEFIFDSQHNNYFVFWSSSFGAHGWDDSRIWCARTADFHTFLPPRMLFDPGFTVIDATIIPSDGTFYMFFKDERFGHVHGEHRYIQIAASARLDGPYEIITSAITPSITEGPAVVRGMAPERWYLFYDHCMNNRYGVSIGEDVLHWQVVDADFPPNTRHGSILGVTKAELATLQAHWT